MLVVALFNAIAKSKRAEQEAVESNSGSKQAPQTKAKDVMEMSRSNFLDLLKGSSSEKTDTSSKKLLTEQEPSSDDENDHGFGGSSWSVLKESYLTDKKLALKVSIPFISLIWYVLGLGQRG